MNVVRVMYRHENKRHTRFFIETTVDDAISRVKAEFPDAQLLLTQCGTDSDEEMTWDDAVLYPGSLA